MRRQEALEEYAKALKEGQREYKECISKKLPPHPAVLDTLLPGGSTSISMGLVEIPISRIVGTKSMGRINAFSPSFRPLLEVNTEFGAKWVSLCADHLGEEGIHDPIECFEYLGNFYIQEGNKRVSVLRHFGGSRVSANVKRILPAADDSPRYKAYQEFLEFYKLTGLYDVQFTTPGGFGKLLERLGCGADRKWTEEERRRFQAGYHYFTEALGNALPQPEEALLTWLQVHPFSDLTDLSAAELKKSVTLLWPNLVSATQPGPVVKTEPPGETSKITKILKGTDHVCAAFVHLYEPDTSHWTRAHEAGRKHLEEALGKAVTTLSYVSANSPERAQALIEQAVAEGADVVFTTSPQLISPCLKVSVKHPKVLFYNCSVHQPYATVRTYYSRIYEGKFITGAIAGAMCKDGRIGYVGSYPIHGVPASINAFALGAQLTNPDAKIQLKWTCLPGNPTQELLDAGIRVISNRDTPVDDYIMNEYGTFLAGSDGRLQALSSPTWVWGKFYENVVRGILQGSREEEKNGQAVNLWWGMRSGVIDVAISQDLPEGVRFLADSLKSGIVGGTIDPFKRRILDQNGKLRNAGAESFTPLELLKMDWLCENVVGQIPTYEQVIPDARSMVELLGVFPTKKEGL